MPFVVPPVGSEAAAGSILDAMPAADQARLCDWLASNRLAAPHAELLRALVEYTRVTPVIFVNEEGSFSRHMAAALAQVAAALAVLDTTLLTVRAQGATKGAS